MCASLAPGCERGPSDEQLDRWLEEARAADREAIARSSADDERAGWTLTVLTPDGASTELRWRELEQIAHTTVDTDLPPEGSVPRHARFRVATFEDILARVGGTEGHRSLTVVAHDGFRATIDVADLEAHPIGLALEADGQPIDRSLGGPLFTVFPISQTPSLVERYTSSWWVFYVTHLLLDTPPPRVRVVDRRPGRGASPRPLETTALAGLPRNEATVSVGYRTGWPSEPVRLEGVLVRELLAARGVTLGPDDRVRVETIAPLTRSDARPTVLSADDVMLRPSMLAMRWARGSEEAAHATEIPARLGGPLTLAVPPAVQERLGDRAWLTHVEGLVVERAGPPEPGGRGDP